MVKLKIRENIRLNRKMTFKVELSFLHMGTLSSLYRYYFVALGL